MNTGHMFHYEDVKTIFNFFTNFFQHKVDARCPRPGWGRAAHSAIIADHHAPVHGKMNGSHGALLGVGTALLGVGKNEAVPKLNSLSSFCVCPAQEQQHLIHSNQAESHTAVGKETAKQEQQRDCGDPGHRL